MHTALYRKLRPKKFSDVIGQEAITTIIKNEIINNRVGHAYLFCGTRGTGKTSTAKIFSKAINCLNPKDGEPCLKCEVCNKISRGILMDINELDAASNNGVDKIRDIIEEVQYPPQEVKYKVYILDEVHMLSQGAVNAFLKTLEEPPKNVIFILATTDPQKLPITILSRCQRFDFKRIKKEIIRTRLIEIVNELGIYAEENSLDLISRISDGSMRDALSMLEQSIIIGDNKLDYVHLTNMLGLVTNDSLINIYDYVIEKRLEDAIKLSEQIISSGKEPNFLIKDFINHLRNILLCKISNNPYDLLDMSNETIESIIEQSKKISVDEIMRHISILIKAEEDSKYTKQSRINFELSLVKMTKINYDSSVEILLGRIRTLENKIINISDRNVSENINNLNKKHIKKITKEKHLDKIKDKENIEKDININESDINLELIRKGWNDVLSNCKTRKYMIIYATLVTGKISSFQDGVVEIIFPSEFAMNKKRLEKEEVKKNVEEVFFQVFGERIKIKYTVENKKNDSSSEENQLREYLGESFEII